MNFHGWRKYPESALLLSSEGRGWAGVSAELRSHPPGATKIAAPQQMEVIIAIKGANDGPITRTGAGIRQRAMPSSGTIWLAPVGIADSQANLSVPVPQVLHLFLATSHFRELAEDYNLPRAPGHSIQFVSGVRDEMIRQLGIAILDELSAETAGGRMLVETMALTLAARLAHSYADGWTIQPDRVRHRLDNARLRRVFDYIETHLDSDITVSALASLSCLSQYHFARSFTAAVGVPPGRYVGQRRIEKAKAMLACGKASLSEIAQAARFSTQASFNRAFKQATGITPGAYRKKAG